jgi:hypothetical protein
MPNTKYHISAAAAAAAADPNLIIAAAEYSYLGHVPQHCTVGICTCFICGFCNAFSVGL